MNRMMKPLAIALSGAGEGLGWGMVEVINQCTMLSLFGIVTMNNSPPITMNIF
jgi:hypothetical protein